jgi:hypothetical protein
MQKSLTVIMIFSPQYIVYDVSQSQSSASFVLPAARVANANGIFRPNSPFAISPQSQDAVIQGT